MATDVKRDERTLRTGRAAVLSRAAGSPDAAMAAEAPACIVAQCPGAIGPVPQKSLAASSQGSLPGECAGS